MEKMDIDMVVSIPDTPERKVVRGSIGRETKRGQHSPDAEYRSYLGGRTRRVPEIGGHIEPHMEFRGDSDTQTGDGHRLRAPRSNALFRRTVDEKDKGKSISTDPRADLPALVQKSPVLNLSKHNGQTHVSAVASSRSLAPEVRKEFRAVHACPPIRGAYNSFMLTGSSANGKEKIECGSPLEGTHNSLKLAWNSNKGKEKVHCDSTSNRQTIDLSSDPQQKRGTKRLVRNGCISPHEIAARARQDADGYQTSSMATMCDRSVLKQLAAENPSSISISEIVSENDSNGGARGKGLEIGRVRVVSRDTDGSDGWKSTHNRKLTIGHNSSRHHESSRRDESSSGRICSSVSRLDVHEPSALDRQQGKYENNIGLEINGRDGNDTRGVCSSASGFDVREPSAVDRESRQKCRKYEHNTGHEINRRDGNDTQGVCSSVSGLDVRETSAWSGEASQRQRRNGFTTAASNERDVIVIGTSGERTSLRPPRIHNHHRQRTKVLEIDDSPPEVRVSRSRGTRHVENDVNARQIEADEKLALELQEQLYREAQVITDELTDEHIARILEQEENSLRASSSHASGRSTRSSTPIAANPRGRSGLRRRMQMLSERRGFNPRQARTSVRVPHGHGQRLGGAPGALHRALNVHFPNDMVLESRLDFLEELENVIGHSMNNSSLLHIDRDFTEGDYELLLALDENNHQHGGASSHHIYNLPQSTVQTDNLQETCVICLETPTVGDTIRHLPCLHKFHKDCIDEWLGRSKSCPVCKSSVS